MLLAKRKIHLTEDDNYRHIPVKISVPSGVKKLVFAIRYSPKYEENPSRCLRIIKQCICAQTGSEPSDDEAMSYIPLANHLSFSLDSPRGWLGTSHRHDYRQEIEIGESSSAGFIDFIPCRGSYVLTVSVNAIVTPSIDVDITAEAIQ